MLTALSIANIVLIERLDLDFEAGLGVLTGETGAGKSILLDAPSASPSAQPSSAATPIARTRAACGSSS